jgi:hemoglobin
MRTIYERHGGCATVRKVVSEFYDRVLDDPLLARHFESVDMHVLVDHQTRFVSFLLGGPASFSDDHIERVHQHLGITLPEFDRMTTVLRETLEDFDFLEEDIAVVDQELRHRESIIVTAR